MQQMFHVQFLIESGQSSSRSSENVSENLNCLLMVPTAKEILFSRRFLGQNYHFLGQSIQDLKVIN